jgi:hypothetical protein
MSNSQPLEERAMLSHVAIHFYGFRKYDRDVSDTAAEAFDADEDSGRYNKSLIERAGLKYLQRIAGSIRRFHRTNTLPWGDDEYRILTSQNYIEHSKGLRDLIATFNKTVDEFCSKELPVLYAQAQKKLGKMYKPDEYPDINSVRGKYWVKVKVKPVPIGDDFRISTFSKKEIDTIRTEIDEEKKSAVDEAMKALWQRLQSPLEKMADKLSEKDSIFRDSLVQNIIDIVELIPKLNLGDPELDKFGKEISKKLCVQDPKELRKDKKLRKETQKAAKEILDRMSAYC